MDAVVEAAQKFVDAGYTNLALVQFGPDHQQTFFDATDELLPALRSLNTLAPAVIEVSGSVR